MRIPFTPRLLAGTVVALLAGSCGGDTIVDCPAGTFYTGSICCPVGTIERGGACAVIEDSGGPTDKGPSGFDPGSAPDLLGGLGDPGPAGKDPGGGADGTVDPGRARPDVPFETTGEIGAPCRSDDDCDGSSVCLSWGGGYCALQDCADDPSICPSGSTCAAVGTGTCLKSCAADTQCRNAEGQHCKGLADVLGKLRRACHGTDGGAAPPGGPCASHSDCAGPATCYAGIPGGLCAEVGCSPTSCGDAAVCSVVDGLPRCLLRCEEDSDCTIGGAAGRSCELRGDLKGEPAKVCFVPQGSAPIGEPCTGGHVCGSGFCLTVAQGACSTTPDLLCNSASDCPASATCTLAPKHHRGVCSADCAFGDTSKCTGGSLCAAATGGDGFCAAACTGAGDPSCDGTAGLRCLFGVPLGSGSERYLCVRPAHPGAMTACKDDAPCGSSGSCLAPPEGEGYCRVPCDSQGSCPFPGHCVQESGGLKNRCYRSCGTVADCPAGMKCTFPAGGARKACVP